MKAYTDLEQSKKLAEILPLESADMRYHTISYCNPYPCDEIIYTVDFGKVSYNYKDIPCWSLAALLSVIPKRIKNHNVLRIDISDNDFAIWYDEIGYGVNNDLPDIAKDNPVDACYEMIVRLKEKGKL